MKEKKQNKIQNCNTRIFDPLLWLLERDKPSLTVWIKRTLQAKNPYPLTHYIDPDTPEYGLIDVLELLNTSDKYDTMKVANFQNKFKKALFDLFIESDENSDSYFVDRLLTIFRKYQWSEVINIIYASLKQKRLKHLKMGKYDLFAGSFVLLRDLLLIHKSNKSAQKEFYILCKDLSTDKEYSWLSLVGCTSISESQFKDLFPTILLNLQNDKIEVCNLILKKYVRQMGASASNKLAKIIEESLYEKQIKINKLYNKGVGLNQEQTNLLKMITRLITDIPGVYIVVPDSTLIPEGLDPGLALMVIKETEIKKTLPDPDAIACLKYLTFMSKQNKSIPKEAHL